MRASKLLPTFTFLAALVAPGAAFAGMILVSSLNPGNNSTSYGFDINYVCTGGYTGNGCSIDPGEAAVFGFNPAALLESFTVINSANEQILGVAIGTGSVVIVDEVGGSIVTFAVNLLANSLQVTNTTDGNDRPGSQRYAVYALNFREAAVPEPGTLSLLGVGLLGLAVARQKARKREALRA